MDDLGTGMTDPKPLVQIKQAIQRLKVRHRYFKNQSLTLQEEMKEMNMKIAIMQHSLIHAKLSAKTQAGQMNGAKALAQLPASLMPKVRYFALRK
jgi:estrogen-related receptor beta like 1